MKPTEKRGRGGKRSLARDIISVILIVVPFLGAAILNVLTKPASDGIDVTGAQVYFTVKMPIQDLYITEAQVTSFCVMSALSLKKYQIPSISFQPVHILPCVPSDSRFR